MGQVISTVAQAVRRLIAPYDRWLANPADGSIVGIENPNAGGKDTYIYPIQVTPAQVASPSAIQLADKDVTYQLNVYPWTRYKSDGLGFVNIEPSTALGTAVTSTATSTLPAGSRSYVLTSLTLTAPASLTLTNAVLTIATWPNINQ